MGDDHKSAGAFRTIGELAADIGRPQHILRYWEKRFPQLKPLTRAGNRRYYRPEDVALVKRIDALLRNEGYTIDGAAKALRHTGRATEPVKEITDRFGVKSAIFGMQEPDLSALRDVRNRLARAVAEA